MNANTHALSFSTFARPSRAQFSPVTRRVSPRQIAHPGSGADRVTAAVAARDFAERSFLRRWMQPGLFDRAQPALTHHRD
jgi:hypothetical protein